MIRKDLNEFLLTIPQDIVVVAATKYVETNDMLELYHQGVKNFGENRVDSFLKKYTDLSSYKDIKWHFIGHLQRNKVKLIINKIDYLHSLDSIELAKLINQYREKPLDVFIEVSINLEASKNGVPFYEVKEFVDKVKGFKNINIVGLMMMAIKNSGDVQLQFAKLRMLRDELEKQCQIKLPYLSMGMSDDYLEAIKEKATHIRLGRILYS